MTIAEVAPLPAIPAVAGMFLFLAFVVLIATAQAWRATIGWLFVKLADLLDEVSILGKHPLGFVSAALRAASHNVWVALSTAALKCETSALFMFHWAGVMIRYMGQAVAELTGATTKTIERIVTVDIPHAAHAATIPLAQRLHGIDRLPARIEAEVANKLSAFRHGIDRIVNKARSDIRTAVRGIDATISNALKSIRGQSRRLTRVEKALGAATFAALVAKALARLGLRWLRCPTNKRMARGMCKVDPSFVDEFLTGALLIVGLTSYRDFVKEAQAGFKLGLEGMQLVVRETKDFDLSKL